MKTITYELLPEIIEEALLYLDLPSILRCKRVCRLFKAIIDDSIAVQLHCEYALTGLRFVGDPVTSLGRQLSLIRERRIAWETLDWALPPEEVIEWTMNAYDYSGGVLVTLRNREFKTINFHPENKTRIRWLDFHARDFVLDQAQDLIIFLQTGGHRTAEPMMLTILSYATLEPHPMAEQKHISIPLEDHVHHIKFYLQLMDDMCAVCTRSQAIESMRLRIWNWKTGKLLVDENYAGCDSEAFSFVPTNAYVVALRDGSGCLSINTISPQQKTAYLMLPELAEGSYLLSISIEIGATLSSRPLEGRKIMMDPCNRVYGIKLVYLGNQAYLPSDWCAFILSHTLERYALIAPVDSIPQAVEWPRWGPSNVRLFDDLPSFDWHGGSEGSMVVVPYSPGEGHKIKVFDFMNTKMSTHEATTVFEKPTIFKGPVITSLPFTEYSRTAPIGFYAGEFFIMDDWRLVAVKHMEGKYIFVPLLIHSDWEWK